jgi:hypothetical protein
MMPELAEVANVTPVEMSRLLLLDRTKRANNPPYSRVGAGRLPELDCDPAVPGPSEGIEDMLPLLSSDSSASSEKS